MIVRNKQTNMNMNEYKHKKNEQTNKQNKHVWIQTQKMNQRKQT